MSIVRPDPGKTRKDPLRGGPTYRDDGMGAGMRFKSGAIGESHEISLFANEMNVSDARPFYG